MSTLTTKLDDDDDIVIRYWNVNELADECGIHRVNMVSWLRNRPKLTPAVSFQLGNRPQPVRLWSAAQVEEIIRMRRG